MPAAVNRICLWSGPRNISTALMYSFAQRDDTFVIDEPLYAHYLKTTGLNHPGREEVLLSQENDGMKVMQHITEDAFEKPVLFCKQMTHHFINLPLDFLSKTKNILLIRDPAHVLTSYAKVVEHPSLDDIGIRQSYEMFEALQRKNFHCVVIEAELLLTDPEGMLKQLCNAVEISFQPAMLQWKGGPIPEDGVWAKYWYGNVHRSTGFSPFPKEKEEMKNSLEPIYKEAKPYYDFLVSHSLRV
jgi:hypothetical protein